MKVLLGTKQAMTQQYVDGRATPVTVLHAGPCVVTGVKTIERDGYTALQLGFGTTKHANKPQRVTKQPSRFVREFRASAASDINDIAEGASLTAAQFAPGDVVRVVGTTKGRGFAGVVKRHGFAGGPASHGHKDQLRMPGSIGSGGVQRVFKGTRMAGQMGNVRVTVQGLRIIHVDAKNNELWVKGAVPGARNGLVMIQEE